MKAAAFAALLVLAIGDSSQVADAVRARARAASRDEGEPEVRWTDAAQRREFDKWLARNRASVEGVKPGPLVDQPWGASTLRPGAAGDPGRLYLHVFDWHASGKLTVYGLAGGAKRAYLLDDAKQSELSLAPGERSTVITVPKQPPDPIDTVVVVELDGEPTIVPLTVKPSEDGKLVLHARDAVIHGRTVRYEPEPHKNTVGYWTDAADWVSWQFEVIRPGKYAVEILQGCGKGSGGSTVEFRCADEVLQVTVQDTGGFQNFVARGIGKLKFDRANTYSLDVKPTKKPGLAVMDLRQVTLTPVGPAVPAE